MIKSLDHPLYDYSAELPFADQAELSRLRAQCREGGLIEGLMLKAKGSTYQQGRIKGVWYKWKRDPLTADVVLMYAQRAMVSGLPLFRLYLRGLE